MEGTSHFLKNNYCVALFSDGYAFSQDENGVVSQSEVIRAYDTTKQRAEWWSIAPPGPSQTLWSHSCCLHSRYLTERGVQALKGNYGQKRWTEEDREDRKNKQTKKKKARKETNRVHYQLCLCVQQNWWALCIFRHSVVQSSSLFSLRLDRAKLSFSSTEPLRLTLLYSTTPKHCQQRWERRTAGRSEESSLWKIAKEQSCKQSSRY